MNQDWPNRWNHVHQILKRPGPKAVEGFTGGQDTIDFLHEVKILVIGAGGLGCELLKNLALTGFKDIHVIDMDTIDVSNLNRQFLFRPKDVGESKAITAAKFIMDRIPGCVVTPYFGKIQDKPEEYYQDFPIIVCGLDSVEARRWMNAMIIGLYDEDDPSTTIFNIDGGTEAFKGQSRVIIPKKTACYECSLDMQTKPKTFPMCTIANTPRLPEHCIQWAATLQWPVVNPGINY
jgi:ubiquitin-activating enzyme E1 C